MILFQVTLDTLTLVQDVEETPKASSISQTLFIKDSLKVNQHYIKISQVIVFSQIIDTNIEIFSLSHHLNLNHSVRVIKTINRSLTQQINLGSQGFRNKTASVTQTLVFNYSINLHPIYPAVINFSQGLTFNVSQPLISILTFNQILGLTKVKVEVLLSHLSLVDYNQVYKLDRRFIAIPVPSFTYHHNIVLTYNTTILQLRDPEFGNSDKYEQSRILRRNRGNELNIYRDSSLPWPETEVLSYTFRALSQADVWNLLYFMQISLGQTIQLKDYENNNWQGIIITPEKEVIEESRVGFSASFEFMGTRI